MSNRHPVILIEPATLFREGIEKIISGSSFDVQLAVASVREAKTRLPQPSSDSLVLIDPGPDPDLVADMLREVREAFPGARIVVLAGAYCPDHLVRCFRAGANGYLLKSVASDVLTTSLRLVMLGEPVFPAQATALLLEAESHQPATRALDVSGVGKRISNREMEILRCLVRGDSNKVIARRLDLAESTVKVHIKTILRKIQLENRTQAAIWALNRGLSSEMADAPPNGHSAATSGVAHAQMIAAE